MAETKTLNVRFQQKIDTAENWANSTIELLAGEIAIESDTNKFKFGNGKDVYKDLPYAGIDQAQLDAIDDNYYRVIPNEGETDAQAIARVIANPKKGDIAVCERAIGGVSNASSLTAYMYGEVAGENNTATLQWRALDGNYDASNVYFDQDLITSFAMGNITLNSGMATIEAAGKNLMQVWESIYVKEINTDLKKASSDGKSEVPPTCTMSGNSTKYYLVGAESAAQTITLGINKGAYKYGYGYVESKDETDPAEGTAAKVRVTTDGSGAVPVATSPYTLTWDGTALTPTTTNGSIFVCNGLTKKTAPVQAQAVGKVKYEKAGNPVSNLGNIYPAQAYADATSAANTQSLARWYYPIYQGFTTDSDNNVIENHATVTAAQLQSGLTAPISGSTKTATKLIDADAYNKTKLTTAVAPGAWRQYFLAYPKSYSFDMSAAKDGNNIDCTVNQAADVTMTFNGVDVVYAVYYIHNASAYGTPKITWTLG